MSVAKPLPKIITLTLNPTLDRTVYVDSLQIGTTMRTKAVFEQLGGKGLNVSKALNALNVSSICLGLVGSNLKDHIAVFTNQHRLISTHFINTNQPTRICSDYITKDGQDFKVNETGLPLAKKFQTKILKEIAKILDQGQIWIISGSLPNGFEDDFYCQIIDLIQTTDSKIILDSSGPGLKYAISKKLFLIKPNLHECEELLGVKINNLTDAQIAVQRLLCQGVESVALSLGKDGLLFGNSKAIINIRAPKVKVIKTTGAGDGLVAGLVFGLINNYEIEQMCKFVVEFASLSTTYSKIEYPSLEFTKKFITNL